MPSPARNEKVKYAISKALKQRGLTHRDVATLLGLAEQTVGNKISLGFFKETEAEKWSAILGIEKDVFMHGREPLPPNDYMAIKEALKDMRSEIDALKQVVDDFIAQKDRGPK